MKQYCSTTHRVWDPMEDIRMNDEVLSYQQHQKRKMSNEVRSFAHVFVLDNAACLQPWREYKIFLVLFRNCILIKMNHLRKKMKSYHNDENRIHMI